MSREAIVFLEKSVDGIDEFPEISFGQRNKFASENQHISSCFQGLYEVLNKEYEFESASISNNSFNFHSA